MFARKMSSTNRTFRTRSTEPRNRRARSRRKVSRSQHDDRLSLRRRRPLRARGRNLAENGLQKRSLHGRRLQSLESRGFTDHDVARTALVFDARSFLRFAFERERQIKGFETDRPNRAITRCVLYFRLFG